MLALENLSPNDQVSAGQLQRETGVPMPVILAAMEHVMLHTPLFAGSEVSIIHGFIAGYRYAHGA